MKIISALLPLVIGVALAAFGVWLAAMEVCWMNDTHGESFFEWLRESRDDH